MAAPSAKLFISCVSDEFGTYRDALRHVLVRPNVEVLIQEDIKGRGGDTLKTLEGYIGDCGTVVHIVGDMDGSQPAANSVDGLLTRCPSLKDELEKKGLKLKVLAALTYTQWEAWLAVGLDKDLVIVKPDPAVKRDRNFSPSDASRRSQTEHLNRLKAIDFYPMPFTGLDNLVVVVLNSAVFTALAEAVLGLPSWFVTIVEDLARAEERDAKLCLVGEIISLILVIGFATLTLIEPANKPAWACVTCLAIVLFVLFLVLQKDAVGKASLLRALELVYRKR